jgi:cellulose synthase/poly-beta-1,6-N-acetylglucosamine synthase-like glycosyltransferase
MEHTKTVTIASPIRDRENYLPTYLECILKQTYPKKLTNLFFVTNNIKDNSIQILKQFKKEHENKFNLIRLDNYNNENIPHDGEHRLLRAKTKKIYLFLAELRNYICQKVNTDYLFSVDSDIMLLPDTLEKLINSKKNCISALVCNGHVFSKQQPDKNIDPYKFTNIM